MPSLILKIERERPAEIYLYLVQTLQPEFNFKHAEAFVNAIEVHQKDGFDSLVKSTNPILTMVIIIEALKNLSSQYQSLSLRIFALLEETEDHFVKTFESYQNYNKLEILL